MRKRKNRIYSKQVLHLTSTPPLSKITSAGILSIWQKETTSSHIWTAIKFEYFDHTKISFFWNSLIFPWFSAKFQIPWFFPAGNFFSPFSLFSLFSRVRGHPASAITLNLEVLGGNKNYQCFVTMQHSHFVHHFLQLPAFKIILIWPYILSSHQTFKEDYLMMILRSFFLFVHNKNACCWYSLEVPQWGTSNEYQQHA